MNIKQLNQNFQSNISNYKVPTIYDKIYKDECIYSYDSPYSDDGLYVNLVSFHGIGKDYLHYDIYKTNQIIYLHIKFNQIKMTINNNNLEQQQQPQPTKLAIGTTDGFNVNDASSYELIKKYSIAIINKSNYDDITYISYPIDGLLLHITHVIDGIINHNGMRSNILVNTWDADNEKFISKYAMNLIQLNPSGKNVYLVSGTNCVVY
jgi:ubiquitin carboxyl-terminal hydrolase 5/13